MIVDFENKTSFPTKYTPETLELTIHNYIVIIRIMVSGADIQTLGRVVRRPNFKIGLVQL